MQLKKLPEYLTKAVYFLPTKVWEKTDPIVMKTPLRRAKYGIRGFTGCAVTMAQFAPFLYLTAKVLSGQPFSYEDLYAMLEGTVKSSLAVGAIGSIPCALADIFGNPYESSNKKNEKNIPAILNQ